MTSSDHVAEPDDLIEVVHDATPEAAVIAVAGAFSGSRVTERRFMQFDPTVGGQPLDSASAIVALERSRTSGAEFLVLPAPTNAWLDELTLFGDHCRSRYSIVFASSDGGTVIDLRRSEQRDIAPSGAAAASTAGGDMAQTEEAPDALDALALSLSQLVRSDDFTANEFRTFERHGVHVTPVHFYHPIPDTAQLADEVWSRESELVGIDMNDAGQLYLLREVFPEFRDEYEALPTAATDDPAAFHFDNGFFDGTDALVLYCMLRHLQPRRVIEIGSGYSTRLAAQAALANGSTELICIDPYPDEVVQAGFAGLTSVITSKAEDVPLDLFTTLGAEDVLFIDSSHVVRIGGDVTFLFLDVLPRLHPDVVVQVHGVFLPRAYPREWVVDGLRFWNEQYLLQAFLTFNSRFRVLMANSYLDARYPNALRDAFPNAPWWGGGSFWMQREAG